MDKHISVSIYTYTRVPPTDKHNAEKCGKYALVAPTWSAIATAYTHQNNQIWYNIKSY